MKTILQSFGALLLTSVLLVAQVPSSPGTPDAARAREEMKRQALMRLRAATNAAASAAAAPAPAATTPGTTGSPTARSSPLAQPGPATGSIVAPSGPDASTNGLTAIAPPAGTTNSSPEETIPPGMIDFRQADLNAVLTLYAELVNRTVLRPATLPAPTITLKTQTPLTKREAVQALDAVLGVNGIATINIGDKFVKVDQLAAAPASGQEFNKRDSKDLADLGSYLTHVVQLKYAKPSEMVQVLQPFAKVPNAILPIDSSQILVLRDFTENVKRMLEMINQVDVAIPSEFVQEVIPIKYALASEIASALNTLSSGGGGATVGSSGTTGGTRTGSYGAGRSSSGLGRSGYGTSGGGYNSSFPGMTPGMTTPIGTSPQATTTPGGTGSTFTDRLRNIINRASTSGSIQVLGETKIIADERTNSLLIFAAREDMKMIKEIIAKLDVVLAQVLIEAVVISVSLDNSKDLGFSYLQHPKTSGNLTGVGAINNKNFLSRDDFNIGGGTNSILPGGFSYLTTWGSDLDVAITAAASDNRAKILQRPRIQTSHAVPASLFVGESRPYPQGSYYGGGAYGSYSSIQQLQIGVTLEVTPLINPDGLVVMDIHNKIDSFENNVTIQGVGDVPVTSSKEAQAKVAVRDHDTIMLGGLIETDKHSTKSGVPYLMDIPLLGYLFRSSHQAETRSELIVLIRPTVLPTPEVAALAATAEKKRLPGVRNAENEINAEEAKRNLDEDKIERALELQQLREHKP
ncbi:MAG TPA: secretin N-terminal domain-containing protein [Candidatus Dormibacteraeota bacterium]|nr:secretin N-terminal domain-containing protein [Candidatus Dormibacteraeota bacterium]